MQLVLVVAWLRAPVNKSWTTRSQSMHLVNSVTLALSGPHPVFKPPTFFLWDGTTLSLLHLAHTLYSLMHLLQLWLVTELWNLG